MRPMHQHTSLLLCILALASALNTNEITGLLAITSSLGPLHADWKPHLVANACTPPIWDGLECEDDSVTQIALGPKNLAGTIPTEVGLFSNLRLLSFIGNYDINGTIPTEIASLPKLKSLFLSVNRLSGTLPTQFQSLAELQWMFIDRNKLSSTLPDLPPNLLMLSMDNNKFEGTLPSKLGLLTLMTDLDLSSNKFTGPLPTQLGRLTHLTQLQLDDNQFTGVIPTEFGQLKSLNLIDLSKNMLSGSLPPFYGFDQLVKIVLSANRFIGNIPTNWNVLARLDGIALNNNSLSGLLSPAVFTNRPRTLDSLFIKDNFFFGPLPDFKDTIQVDISGNFFLNHLPKSSNPLGLPLLKSAEFNQICCCSAECPHCSGYICPNSLGGPLSVNPGSEITITTPVIANQIVNSGTLHIVNTHVSTTTLILLNTTTFDGVKLNTTYFSVFSGVTAANNSNMLITGGLQLAPGATLQISNTTLSVNGTLEALGNLVVSGEYPIVVDCFTGGASSGLVFEVTEDLRKQIQEHGFKTVPVIKSTANCFTGTFGAYSVSAAPDSCYVMSLSTTTGEISATLSPCNSTSYIVGGIVGATVFLLVILATIVLSYWQITKAGLRTLPSALRWQWEQYYLNPALWKHKGEGATKVFYQKLGKSTSEWTKMREVLDNCLDGQDIQIAEAYALFQPGLIQNFVNNREVRARRVADAPHLFNRQTWKNTESQDDLLRRMIKHKVNSAIERASETAVANFQKSAKLSDLDSFNSEDLCADALNAPTKAWVYDRFLQRVEKCSWNEQGEQVPILATAHGTDLGTGWAIAQTGFAKLSLLDKGFYGTGIYFTTRALYTYPYFATKRPPAIVLSYVVPGNVFPVNEHHQGFDSLMGAPILAGYDSNYVVTNAQGHVPNSTTTDESQLFDEIVVQSEGSIAPAYLLALDTANFGQLTQKWTRLSPSSLPRKDSVGLPIFASEDPTLSEEIRLEITSSEETGDAAGYQRVL